VHGNYRNCNDDHLREELLHTKKKIYELKETFSQFLKTRESKKKRFRSRHVRCLAKGKVIILTTIPIVRAFIVATIIYTTISSDGGPSSHYNFSGIVKIVESTVGFILGHIWACTWVLGHLD